MDCTLHLVFLIEIVKKGYFKLPNNINIIRNLFTKFLKFGSKIDILGLEKSLSRAPTWLNYFFQNFSTAILKSKKKTKKMPQIFVSAFRSWENIFLLFSVPCKKKKKLALFFWLVWANTSLSLKSWACFCAAVMFLGMCKVKGFWWNLLKWELFKDKILNCVSFLWHIHHKNWLISSALNTKRKQIISKTSKVTPVNIMKTNELIVLLWSIILL